MAPVFIVCAMRSYSSLIAAMLGQHPELYGLPEINIAVGETIGEVIDFYDRRTHGLHGLLRTVAQLSDGEQSEQSIAKASEFLTERRDWGSGRMLDWIEDLVAPKRIVDKSPVVVRSVDMMQRLARLRPDAQFLHIVRQTAAVCRSIDRLHEEIEAESGKTRRSRVNAEQVWLKSNTNVMAFKSSLPPGKCLTLQGEAFLAEFDLYAPQVCEWLEISSDKTSLKAMLKPETSPFACIGPENAKYGNDPNFLKSPAFHPRPIEIEAIDDGVDGRAFQSPTRKLARELGYA